MAFQDMWFLYCEWLNLDTCFIYSSFAWQAVAEVIRTTLGPRSMLKMLLDAAGGDIYF